MYAFKFFNECEFFEMMRLDATYQIIWSFSILIDYLIFLTIDGHSIISSIDQIEFSFR